MSFPIFLPLALHGHLGLPLFVSWLVMLSYQYMAII